MSLVSRLYNGELDYDFVGHSKRWYVVSGVFIALSLVGLLVRGVNLGIDFKGGSTYQLTANGHTTADASAVLKTLGIKDPTVQKLGENQIRITTEVQTNAQVDATITALAAAFGETADQISPSTVGPTWGSQVSNKALQGLVIFLILVVCYMGVRFEPKLAFAAILALVHDLLITGGIYTLVGFEVTPSTVVALLTILGFSLYDTVVVFDRVRENTADIGPNSKHTYTWLANRALNETVMRSINTSLIALLPVSALLFVGAGLLGAGTLKDLALAQFIGLAAGAYSSIFIATPLAVKFKESEPAMVALQAKVERAERLANTEKVPVGTGSLKSKTKRAHGR